jgi:putative lipoprotein
MNFTKTLGVVSLALILAACSKQAEEQPTLFFNVREDLPKQAVSPDAAVCSKAVGVHKSVACTKLADLYAKHGVTTVTTQPRGLETMGNETWNVDMNVAFEANGTQYSVPVKLLLEHAVTETGWKVREDGVTALHDTLDMLLSK